MVTQHTQVNLFVKTRSERRERMNKINDGGPAFPKGGVNHGFK